MIGSTRSGASPDRIGRAYRGLGARYVRAEWRTLRAPLGEAGLPGCSGEVGGDDVGGVAVEGDPGAVVAHRRARVGVRGRLLNIAQRDAGIKGGGDPTYL